MAEFWSHGSTCKHFHSNLPPNIMYDDLEPVANALITVIIINVYSSIGDTFEETNNGYARVNYKGEIIWYNMVVTVTFCKLLIRYFPFDMQHCNLSFTSWNYDLSQVFLLYSCDVLINLISYHFDVATFLLLVFW